MVERGKNLQICARVPYVTVLSGLRGLHPGCVKNARKKLTRVCKFQQKANGIGHAIGWVSPLR